MKNLREKKIAVKAACAAIAATVFLPLASHTAYAKPVDVSKLTEKERQQYELTKEHIRHLPKYAYGDKYPAKYFDKTRQKGPYQGSEDTLPSAYDSREKGVISPVKDQSSTGTCWAHAIMEAAQASAASQEKPQICDLSERHLAYFLYHSVNDSMSLTKKDSVHVGEKLGSAAYYEIGGNNTPALMGLAKGVGFADEDTASFDELMADLIQDNQSFLEDEKCYEDAYMLKESYGFIADKNNQDQQNGIKEMIMKKGAGIIGFNCSDRGFDYTTFAYNFPDNDDPYAGGHAVAVVGWDDNYPKENFNYEPENDGAWLIKNSWGDCWGEDGYFWMSYEEQSIQEEEVVFLDIEETGAYDSIYQYDGTISGGATSGYLYTANVFTANREEDLKAVSFYTMEDSTDYTVSVYLNPEKDQPDSGKAVAEITGSKEHLGYHVQELEKPVSLKKGDTFSIVVKQTKYDEEEGDDRTVDVFCDRDEDWGWASMDSSSNAGESYASKDGTEWEDCSADGGSNFRIKGFTSVHAKDYTGTKLAFSDDNYKVELLGKDGAVKVLLDDVDITAGAALKYRSDAPEIATVDSMGNIEAKKPGETAVTVTYKDMQATTVITVEESEVTLSIQKDADYATEEKPFQAFVGSEFTLEYEVSDPKYKKLIEIENVECLDRENADDAYIFTDQDKLCFSREGLFRVTLSSVCTKEPVSFYIDVQFDTVSCGDDISKIAMDPYPENAFKIFRYDGGKDGYTFLFDEKSNLNNGNDRIAVLGFDSSEVTDQQIYDQINGVESEENAEGEEDMESRIDYITDFCGVEQSGDEVNVPHPYVAFVLISDENKTGNFAVKSVKGYKNVDRIRMKAEDITIPLNETVEIPVELLDCDGNKLEDWQVKEISASPDNVNLLESDISDNKVTLTGQRVGKTQVFFYVYEVIGDDFFNTESVTKEDADEEGYLEGIKICLDVSVTTEDQCPEEMSFVDGDQLTVTRNSLTELVLSQENWYQYEIQYESSVPETAYVSADGILHAVSSGKTTVKAMVDVDGEHKEAKIDVTVSVPEEQAVANLQTTHEYVQGMEDTYVYTAEGAECMNLYFDSRTLFGSIVNEEGEEEPDYMTIRDGNGYYYGFDEQLGRMIMTRSKREETLPDSYFWKGASLAYMSFSVYSDTVTLHFVSQGKCDPLENPEYTNGNYGFRVKRIVAGKAVTELKLEDVEAGFETYNSNIKRARLTRVPADAVDIVYYQVTDNDVAGVDNYGKVSVYKEGETTFTACTYRPEEQGIVSNEASIKAGAIPFERAEFYLEENDEKCEVPDQIEVIAKKYRTISCKMFPWNTTARFAFDYDDSVIDISNGNRGFDIRGIKPGESDVKVYLENDPEKKTLLAFHVTVVPGDIRDIIPESYLEFAEENFEVYGNGDKDPMDITPEDIQMYEYEPWKTIYWRYECPQAQYIDLAFLEDGSLIEDEDWIYLYDLDGQLLQAFTGDDQIADARLRFAGETFRVDGSGFILAFSAGESAAGKGFGLSSITPHFAEESSEQTPVSQETPKAPAVGTVLKDTKGNASYEILSADTVSYRKPASTKVKSVKVPDTVTLNGVTYKVTQIAPNACKKCKNLKKVTIGKNVTKIGKNAFSGAKKLKKLTIRSAKLRSVGKNAIKGIDKKAVIKVLKSKKKAYQKLFKKNTGFVKTMKIK